MIAYFNKSLIEHLGKTKASGSFSQIGLSDYDIIQINTNNGLESFIKVLGDFDKSLCAEIITEKEANKRIQEHFIPQYEIVNEALMSISLNQKISDGNINLQDIQLGWSLNQQNQFLYDNGILGISKSQPRLFEEVQV